MIQIWTQIVIHPLTQSLTWLKNITDSYGVALILLAVGFKFLLLPIVSKQIRNAKMIQALQPQLGVLRQHYSDNPVTLNQEIMKLYQQNGISPFSGCIGSFILPALKPDYMDRIVSNYSEFQ